MAKKDEILIVRVSNRILKEAERGAKERTNGNVSEYIRLLICSQNAYMHPEIQNELMKLRQEVNRIGVNINQIVKNNNSGIYLYRDKEQISAYMKNLIKEFKELEIRINKM